MKDDARILVFNEDDSAYGSGRKYGGAFNEKGLRDYVRHIAAGGQVTHSAFWRDHPEFRREPGFAGWPWTDAALDYSHAEVRAYWKAFLAEAFARYDVDFNLPYTEWARLLKAANRHVLVVPGLDGGAASDGQRHFLSLGEYAVFADRMYRQGAPGLYLFNLFDSPKESGVWEAILSDGFKPTASRNVHGVSMSRTSTTKAEATR